MHADAGPLVLVACWEDRAAAAHCRHDQHPFWLPDSSNPAIPASRNRGLALATMRRDRRHAMLGRKEHDDGIGVHAMARETSMAALEPHERAPVLRNHLTGDYISQKQP